MRTISDALGRDNNFDLLRLVAAAGVVWWHAYALTLGSAPRFPLPAVFSTRGLLPGDLAVHVFFLVSGFLIAWSFERSRSTVSYLAARALRILPALVPATIFAALIIGPLVTRLPIEQYLARTGTWGFILHNSVPLKIQFTLPGVFETNPFPYSVNGALWTLPMELRMYGLVAFIGWLGLLNRPALFNWALAATVFVYLTDSQLLSPLTHGHPGQDRLAGYFLIGMAFYVNRSHIPLHGALALTLAGVAAFAAGTTAFVHLFAIALGYAVFWFAFHRRLRFYNAGKRGDFSYGLYIYHFPLQQALVLFYDLTPLALALVSLAATACFAYLSWHYIERPALGLKRYFSPRLAPALAAS